MKVEKKSGSLSLLLFFAISLMPVYVFPSGGVQPAHLLAFIFAIIFSVKNGLRLESWSLLLLILTFYILIVEGVYIILGSPPRALITFFFFFFSFIISQALFTYVERCGLRTVILGTIVATITGVIAATYSGIDLSGLNGGGRQTGTFNNPNQLGFFSVCLLSMTYLAYMTDNIRFMTSILLFGSALLLSILSLSKAAMIANALIIFIAMRPKLSLSTIPLWLVSVLTILLALDRQYKAGNLDTFLFIRRVQGIAYENDSSLESRGYFAFLDGDLFEIFLGHGSFKISEIIGHEVHSTIGSIINNYGFIGGFIFMAILMIWALRIFSAFGVSGLVSITAPSMLYGITHNGTRFMFFWVLFATSLAMANRQLRPKILTQKDFTTSNEQPRSPNTI